MNKENTKLIEIIRSNRNDTTIGIHISKSCYYQATDIAEHLNIETEELIELMIEKYSNDIWNTK